MFKLGYMTNIGGCARAITKNPKGTTKTGGEASVASSHHGSMRQFTCPYHMKSSLAPEQVCAVILSHVERCF
jgi:hypothetical protein